MVLELEEEGGSKAAASSAGAPEDAGASGAPEEPAETSPAPKPRRNKRPSMLERGSGAAGFWFGSQLSEHNVNIEYQNTFKETHEEAKSKKKKKKKDGGGAPRTRSRRVSSSTAFFNKFLGCAYRKSRDDLADGDDGGGGDDDASDESESDDEGGAGLQRGLSKRVSSFAGGRAAKAGSVDSDDGDSSGSGRASVGNRASRSGIKRMTPTHKSLSLAAIDASGLDDFEAGHKFAHYRFGKNWEFQDFPEHPLNRELDWYDYLAHTELCTMNYDALLHGDTEKLAEMTRVFMNLRLKTETLAAFLGDVWRMMPPKNFYHNFSHICDVSQCMYTLLVATRLVGRFDPLVVCAAICAAICHDLEHPGLSNVFQNSEKTALSLRYDGKSPLENHHCACFDLLVTKHGLLDKLNAADGAKFTALVKRMILTTDMANHNQLMSAVRERLEGGQNLLADAEGTALVLSLVLKCSDISNQARPWRTAERWTGRVYEEFYHEGDLDRAAGRPVSALHDRGTNNIAKSSVGFITYIVEPLYKLLGAAIQACAGRGEDIHVRVVDECLVTLSKNKERHKQVSEGLEPTPFQTEDDMVAQDHNDRLRELAGRPGCNGYQQLMQEKRFNYRAAHDGSIGRVDDEDANADRSCKPIADMVQFFKAKGESTTYGEAAARHHEPAEPAPEERRRRPAPRARRRASGARAPATPTAEILPAPAPTPTPGKKMKRVSKAEAALRREAKAAEAAAIAAGELPPKKSKKRTSTLKKVSEQAARNPEASPEEPSPGGKAGESNGGGLSVNGAAAR
ncbi:3',5'-cyclic-nucleotide phosphodiesterase [Aureococcus anophagefferens]|uniref:Phosphodiesterase n=2 Tax=Aureococcus anophagefferens TaxID=44056 RepID=A0ABR1GCA1_AURAN